MKHKSSGILKEEILIIKNNVDNVAHIRNVEIGIHAFFFQFFTRHLRIIFIKLIIVIIISNDKAR